MAETRYTVTALDSTIEYGTENYSANDLSVVDGFTINSAFNQDTDTIELHIYSEDSTLLLSQLDYRGARELQGSEKGSHLTIDPEQDAISAGFSQGDVTLVYNFIRNINSEIFYIQEISADRTELKILPVNPIFDASELVAQLQADIASGAYFEEFRLNFGNNDLLIGINIEMNNSILIKLYEPLPTLYSVRSQFTFDEIISDSVAFQITAEYIPSTPTFPSLRGANFNIETNEEQVQPTEYFGYDSLYSYNVTSSLHGTITQLSSSGVELSIDFTDYTDYVHFSSAEERLRNFHRKMERLEEYTFSSSISTTYKPQYDNSIKSIISKFDEYEKFLYFKSGSKSWPKTNSNIPYINDEVSNVSSWYTDQLTSASLYDELNESRLTYTVPEFIREDGNNVGYLRFLDMVGQHFDNIWVYSKAMSDKYDADNRLDYGISKDLIKDTLQSFGVKLYSSNFSVSNLAANYVGEFYQTGSEIINSFVTASNDPTPDKDILSETYKRIYHNLPYLMKTKGTERGLRALINCFGVPSSSLDIDVYGGDTRNDILHVGFFIPTDENKIRISNTGSLVSGSTLSQYVSIQQPANKHVKDLHTVEVGFSPAKQINNWLKTQFNGSYSDPDDYASPYLGVAAYVLDGDFNIDEYIGDPTLLSKTQYRDLTALGELYLGSRDMYNVFDFVRLIKFFDNQLFKMVKDFVPARSSVNTGIIIKPHFLNRSKIKVPTPTWSQPEYSGSIDTAFITGSEGNVIPLSLDTTNTIIVSTLSGSIEKVIDNKSPQYNGELSGSVMTLTTQSLNPGNKYVDSIQPHIEYDITRTTIDLLYYNTLVLSGGADAFVSSANNPEKFVFRYLETGLFPNVDYELLDGKINKQSANGLNLTGNLNSITAVHVQGRKYNIKKVIEYTDHYYIDFEDIPNTSRVNTPSLDTPIYFEGYVDKTFYNSDYNAIINNTNNSRISRRFLQSDRYSGTNPNNIVAILNTSASKAAVQDSNYSSKAFTRVRYDGSSLTSAQLNKYTEGDNSYGRTPVVSQLAHYFAYANSAERLDPLVINRTQYTSKYLIDELENVIDLDAVPNAYLYTEYNFPKDTRVNVQLEDPLYNGVNSYYLNGMQGVYKAGKRAEYIHGTETSIGSFTSSIDFPFPGNPSDYGFTANNTSLGAQTLAPNNIPNVVDFVTIAQVVDTSAADFGSSTSDTYTFKEDSEAKVQFTVQGVVDNISTQVQTVTVAIRLGTTEIASSTFTVPAQSINLVNGEAPFQVTTSYRNFTNTNELTVVAYSPGGIKVRVKSATFTNNQNPKASKAINAGNTPGSVLMWSTGSAGNPWLTGSSAISSIYNKDRIQAPSRGSSFPSASLPLTVEIGDEFRFDGDETYTHQVTDVYYDGKVYVKLNASPVGVVDTTKFTHRRFVEDATSIITNQKKVPGSTSQAYIIPEFSTPNLEENAQSIIVKLRSQNLL